MEKKEKRPPFVLIVVQMKKPYGNLFLSKPTNKQIIDLFATEIQDLAGWEIEERFDILRFDISEDIEKNIAGLDL